MFSRTCETSLAFAGLLALASTSPVSNVLPRAVSFANAEAAYSQLQTWYNQSTGLWIPSTGWWNSANCVYGPTWGKTSADHFVGLTVISDLAAIDQSIKSKATSVMSNTYTQAQRYNLQMAKVQGVEGQPFLPHTFYGHHYPEFPPWFRGKMSSQVTSGFLNDYYDDEGWWALGWIAAYDVTGNQQYLSQAQAIFADMNAVFGKTNCSTNSAGTGGIWWDKPHSYVNAIANELFLSVASHLANRPKLGSSTNYLAIATQQWTWFKGTGMINAQNTINDGLDQQTCKNNAGIVWSYNQGVVLGGLTELSKATGDKSYITTAQKIADAAIAALAPSGILKDPCEPNCGGDGTQFKGVFMRNLQILQKASPQTRYATFLDNNADSIWSKDRVGNGLSVQWAGPFVSPANASTQSSAMDALVASLAT